MKIYPSNGIPVAAALWRLPEPTTGSLLPGPKLVSLCTFVPQVKYVPTYECMYVCGNVRTPTVVAGVHSFQIQSVSKSVSQSGRQADSSAMRSTMTHRNRSRSWSWSRSQSCGPLLLLQLPLPVCATCRLGILFCLFCLKAFLDNAEYPAKGFITAIQNR